MPEEPNPFELTQPAWGRMPTPQLTPQAGGLGGGPEGSYFALSPEAMQMMWAPQAQPGLTPQPQVPLPPLQPPA